MVHEAHFMLAMGRNTVEYSVNRNSDEPLHSMRASSQWEPARWRAGGFRSSWGRPIAAFTAKRSADVSSAGARALMYAFSGGHLLMARVIVMVAWKRRKRDLPKERAFKLLPFGAFLEFKQPGLFNGLELNLDGFRSVTLRHCTH